MKRWAVEISPLVESLITAQVLHIAEDSLDHALAWEGRLNEAIHALADTPGLGIDEDASERLGVTVRKMVFEGTYLVHFWLDESTGALRVIGFRHGARRPRRGEP